MLNYWMMSALFFLSWQSEAAGNGALLIIDMQKKFATKPETPTLLNTTRGLDYNNNFQIYERVIERQIKLIESAKQKNAPIFIFEYHRPDLIQMDSTDSRLLDAIEDYPLATILTKSWDGVFQFDGGGIHSFIQPRVLNLIFQYYGITRFVVAGANGPYCVFRSIGHLLSREYAVLAASDGIVNFVSADFTSPFIYGPRYFRICRQDVPFVESQDNLEIESWLEQEDGRPSLISRGLNRMALLAGHLSLSLCGVAFQPRITYD